ncbi:MULTISPECIES: prepilin-type N-terminal cleavage/methylation domain-containing protein [Cyanophyceae]|uniref:prepilin-type N-terminal cleavage/methylation domain-containing protein n=1 Tax=Cyanophyceae TaxID=3028117 RepID=UPI0016835892|nr:prepilin-type N-terminal cleavage/methylation domain-containing protein [Trichocoleus sp. FACHB-69]MBD1932521.1 prepilin-type N-terminal cleavage/methylation domain-containing protein [Trichocoleus sp. FACHB-69]
MDNLALLKKIQQYQSKQSPSESNSGFTLIELIVVIIIVGILSAIAAPGWLGFLNRQRVNAVNDAALNALQEAQREAKRTKLSYSVSFQTPNGQRPQVVVYPGTTAPAATDPRWKTLAENQDIKPGQVQVTPNANLFTFDYQGIVSQNQTLPYKVTVSLLPNNAVKRCVKVTTLLGTIQTGKEASECS